MAAPTVGAVMADILPYLGVERKFSEEEAAGRTVVLEDMTGMTAKDAHALLKQWGLTAQTESSGETVTAQIPDAGQSVPGDSQVILYFGEPPEQRLVTVPDFTGLNRQQANDAAGALGLYIQVAGNDSLDPKVVVTAQSEPKDSQVPAWTTIRLTFADTKAND
jgi:stage V sporulation protein D (sporulation-specific penicillin-binding protein)